MDERKLEDQLAGAAARAGAGRTAAIAVADIPFNADFRAMCEMNTCGRFGRCWMCPPDVGPIGPMIERAKGYERAFVFQTVGELEDSFDIEGMEAAAVRHNTVLQSFMDATMPLLDAPVYLGAGACHVCERCARMDDAPCRHPDRAIASLESYGIAVSELAALCDLKYINGQNTVTYFSAVLYQLKTEAGNGVA